MDGEELLTLKGEKGIIADYSGEKTFFNPDFLLDMTSLLI